MFVLAVIPARGGSKGVPRKNLKPLAGKPLVAYTIETAQAVAALDAIVLSTDDEDIAQVGRELGLDVPRLRPAELATDHTPMLDVLQHEVAEAERAGTAVDVVVLLQPTSPLRRAHHIEACLALLSDVAADAVVTVRPVPDEHNPAWVYRRDAEGRIRLWDGSPAPIPRRQDLAPAFHRDGLVYAVRRDVLMERGSLYGEVTLGHVVDDVPLVNIDTPADWALAEACIGEVGA